MCKAGCTFKRSKTPVQSKALSDLEDLPLLLPLPQTLYGRTGLKKKNRKKKTETPSSSSGSEALNQSSCSQCWHNCLPFLSSAYVAQLEMNLNITAP